MPAAPILDFETVDLSTVVATPEDIYERLKQRGRFALLDGILHFEPEDAVIVGFKEIRADDWWAADHIPGRPLFPGALMIETGAQLCSYDYLRRSSDTAVPFIGFGGLGETRFRGAVEPGARLVVAGRALRLRSRMFTYQAQGFVERQLVFETEVIGVML